MRRLIIFEPSCDVAAMALGGWQVLDVVLERVLLGLVANPYDFPVDRE